MDKIGIVVLMSTYNGEKYLREQIDSILHQTDVDVELLIRDDGSNDSTPEIIRTYTDNYKNITFIQGANKGFVKSFSDLVVEGLKMFPRFQFFAFADQDDIWMPEKLFDGISKISVYEPNIPNLYTSNSILINSNGEDIGRFHHIHSGNPLPIVFPSEQGCSMVFNRIAASIYGNNLPINTWHDRWMYLICSYIGNAYYENIPMFYYRLHNNNALGNSSDKSLIAIIKEIQKPSRHYVMATEFYNRFKDSIKDDRIESIRNYINYRKSFLNRFLYLLTEKRLYTKFCNHDVLGIVIRVLLGKL